MARRRNLLHLQLSGSDVYLFFDGWTSSSAEAAHGMPLNGRTHLGDFDFSGAAADHGGCEGFIIVALILAELKLDHLCIVAAILHDCIEDTSVTKDDVLNEFGDQVAHIVEGVSKLTNLEFTSSSQKQAENFQKLILAMSKDM